MADRTPVALVTDIHGTAGPAICLALAAAGFALLVNGQSDDIFPLQSMNPSSQILAMPFDVTDERAIESVLRSGVEAMGGLDVLVNNAYFWNDAALDNITEDMWEEVIHRGLKGTFYCCRAVSKVMKAQEYGKIINIVGTSAITGVYTQYAAACAGIHSLTRSLCRELAPHVRVNTIAAGLIDEPWIDDGGPELRELLTKSVLLKRLCHNEDVSEAVSYLACGADFMTGQMIVLDGGESLGG